MMPPPVSTRNSCRTSRRDRSPDCTCCALLNRLRGLGSALTGCLSDALCNLSFDLIAIRAAGIELPHQPGRARAQPRAHLGKVLVGHLAHRAVELELLDRAQHQRLLAFERRSRPSAQHLRSDRLVAADERRERAPRRDADDCRGEDGETQKDDPGRCLAGRDEDDDRGADEAGEREQLPGVECVVRLNSDATPVFRCPPSGGRSQSRFRSSSSSRAFNTGSRPASPVAAGAAWRVHRRALTTMPMSAAAAAR